MKLTAKDWVYANRARRHGVPAGWSSQVIRAAKRAGVQYSLAFALVQTETGFQNIFGHDAVKNTVKSPPGGVLKVTKANYLEYKRQRRAGLGMQGVGPCQLTWYELQDQADLAGGCWVPEHNMTVGLKNLRSLVKQHGPARGVAAYNGAGDAADRYSRLVWDRQRAWHAILTKGVR